MELERRPYTSQWHGWRSLVSVLWKDYRTHRNPIEFVSRNIEEAQMMEHWAFGGPETPEMIARATELVKSELHEYSVEELVNYQLSALWKNHL